MTDWARVREALAEIAADMERDVEEREGRPMNGRIVAESFGHQAAAIQALANIVAQLVPDDEESCL